MRIKATGKEHCASFRMSEVQNTDTTKGYQGWAATGTLFIANRNTKQASLDAIWQFLTKLNARLLYNLALVLLGIGSPLQYSCPENPMDTGVWRLQSMGSQRVRHD